MKRELKQLVDAQFDLLVVGGGIYGLFTAWDAALRGLSVALVEKGDFGHATSLNSLRVIHGGLRYLQHGDLGRMRISIRERTNLMRIAPHLVHPLPFLIPAFGHGLRGRNALALALRVHDLVGFDRNRLPDPQKRLPASRTYSRRECLERWPEVAQPGVSGAALVYDCQLYSSERLMAAVLRSAVEAGACAANYVEATGLITPSKGVRRIRARDVLSGGELDIRARVVVNACGPWDGDFWRGNGSAEPPLRLSKAFNLLVNRRVTGDYAVGVYSRNRGDASASRGSRLFFVIPWRGFSLIGTEHLPYQGSANGMAVSEEETEGFLLDINRAFPQAEIRPEDICQVYGGLLPADGFAGREVRLTKHFRIHDHQKDGGPTGVISVVGVKFTESRYVAARAVDLVFRKLGKAPPQCRTAETPVYGGNIERFGEFLEQELHSNACGLGPESLRELVHHYGAAYPEVQRQLDGEPALDWTEEEAQRVLEGQVLYAVRREMAQKLSDVVFRRTSLGLAFKAVTAPAGHLELCAGVMARELGWTAARTEAELDEVGIRIPREVGTP